MTLTCAAPAGHALIGRALYLPADRAADEERRELAGVPDDVMLATKPQLAGTLLQQAHDRGIRAGFIAGDEVYGGLDLRKSIRERGTGYVLAVRSSPMVTLPSGRRLTVKTTQKLLKPGMRQRMRTGSATKGAKDYHRAMIEITPGDTPEGRDDGHAVLLLRKHRYTGTVSHFLCWTPRPVPLEKLISAAVTRWRIEEDHQQSKQVTQLDSGQVTTWTSWHRRTAISLPACLPGLSRRWHPRPSCAPYGARHSDGEAGRGSRRRSEREPRPGSLMPPRLEDGLRDGRVPGDRGRLGGRTPARAHPAAGAPAGGQAGTWVRLPGASVPCPPSR